MKYRTLIIDMDNHKYFQHFVPSEGGYQTRFPRFKGKTRLQLIPEIVTWFNTHKDNLLLLQGVKGLSVDETYGLASDIYEYLTGWIKYGDSFEKELVELLKVSHPQYTWRQASNVIEEERCMDVIGNDGLVAFSVKPISFALSGEMRGHEFNIKTVTQSTDHFIAVYNAEFMPGERGRWDFIKVVWGGKK